MKVTITLDTDLISRLTKLVNKDLDTSDKNALDGFLWMLAEKANLCDSEGNPK